MVERLDDRHRCINVDLLGHGASPPGSDTALFGQVAAVQSFLEDLGVEASVLVGHSFGGFVATVVATTGLVRGIVNVDQPFDVWSAVLETPPDELAAQVEALLPSVASPYLGIYGSPLSATEARLQALIPEGTVEVWDGLGHFVQLVDPERTAARIASFAGSLG